MSDEAQLARLLEERPRSVEAHVRIAEGNERARRADLAIYHYRTALRLADCQEIKGPLAEIVANARDRLAMLQAAAHVERERRLTRRGLPPERRSPRLVEALDIAGGRRRLYRQEPTAFTYPGLPSIQFFEREDFDWVPALEAATPVIREELLGLLETHADQFEAYVQHNSIAPEANKALLGSRDWSVLSLCERGWLSPKLVDRCPATWQAILGAPLPRISGWGPTVTFSLLKGGARIAPHNGMFNTRLICHLPLIVPENCGFRVGNDVRQWKEGKLLIFDDTIEHEAWNESDEDRIVLIFDIWRPELSEQERSELTALFSD
jgi:aspartyl/asparaginyl beta-hydroxylase (cupin superfamily)